MKCYKIGDKFKIKRVADSDVKYVPSHWKEIKSERGGEPNVKLKKPKKTKEEK